MAVVFSNNATTTLASSVTNSATSLTVQDGSVFPTLSGADYTYVTLEDLDGNVEIVKLTARSGNTLTVARAQDGTSARAFSSGSKCELRLTAALLNEVATQADTDTNTTYTAGSGLSLTGTEFANTAPDQTVALTGAGATSISGTYPNFTITSTDTLYTLPFADNSANWNTAYGWGDHGTEGYATQTYVGTAISNLVDSSPATLDTLNELAAALGDDPNFATTVSNSIGTKWTQDNTKISNWDTAYSWGNHASAGYAVGSFLPLTGGTLTGGLTGTTATFASQLIVRGAGNSSKGNIHMGAAGDGTAKWTYLTGAHYNADTESEGIALIGCYAANGANNIHIGGSIYESNPATTIQFWTHTASTHSTGGSHQATIDGSGNFNLLRGSHQINGTTVIDSSRQIFAKTGTQVGEDGTYAGYGVIGFGGITNGYNRVFGRDDNNDGLYLAAASGRGIIFRVNGSGANSFAFNSTGNFQLNDTTVIDSSRNLTNIGTLNGGTPWTSSNDGSGSGLDADLLDGQQGSYYAPASGGNYWPTSGSWWASNMPGSRARGTADNGGEVVILQDNPSAGRSSILVDGQYYAGENGGFYSLYSENDYNLKSGWNTNTSGNLLFTAQTLTQFTTQHGNIQFGPMNGSWAHIYTDRPAFYFNKEMRVNNNLVWNTGNDGSGSGLDADLLDGQHASAFLSASPTSITIDGAQDQVISTTTHSLLIKNMGVSTSGGLVLQGSTGTHGLQMYWDTGGYGFLDAAWANWDIQKVPSGTFKVDEGSGLQRVWNAGNDGSGSGLDADLLDGLNSTSFVRSDTNTNLASGHKWTFHSGAGGTSFGASHYSMGIDTANGGWSHPHYSDLIIGYHTGVRIGASYSGTRFYNNSPSTDANNDGNGDAGETLLMTVGGHLTGGSGVAVSGTLSAANLKVGTWNSNNQVWHAGNDGSGSGLDADLLDGIDSSRVVYGDNATGSSSNQNPNNTLKSGFFDTYNNNTPTATWYSMFHSRHNNVGNNHGHQIAGSFYDNNLWNRNINNGTFGAWNKNWSSNNDGSGSGLDADLLDGQQPSQLSVSYAVSAGGTNMSANRTDGTAYPIVWGTTGGTSQLYSCAATTIRSSDGTIFATHYRGSGNVGGTGEASHHPAGIYSNGNNWLYGTAYRNGSSDYYAGGSMYQVNRIECTQNYGEGVYGVYSSYRFQHVWSMGTAYKLATDGTTTGNMYGMAWSHPNAGGAASNLNDHGLLLLINGSFKAAISSRAVFSSDVRGTLFYDYNDTGLYVDPNSLSSLRTLQLQGTANTTYGTPNLMSYGTSNGAGVVNYHLRFNKNDGTANGHISTNAYATTYATTSDHRVKEDVQPMVDATSRLMALNPVNFQWKDSDIRTDGFIAHEVAEVVSDAVVGEKDAVDEKGNDELQSLDQSKLVPLLVKTIQEQQGVIDALEARISALEA